MALETVEGEASPPPNIAEAVNIQKKPPPESPQNVWTRRMVILAFWAVALLLGMPVWWKTTEVYRASLPLSQMTDWAEGKNCKPVFPLRIAVKAPMLSSQEIETIIRITQHALDDLNDFSAHHLRLVPADPIIHRMSIQEIQEYGNKTSSQRNDSEDISLLLNLKPSFGSSTSSTQLQPYAATLDIYFPNNQVPLSTATSSPLANFIANELQALFSEEQASLSYLMASIPSVAQTSKSKALSSEMATKLSRRSTRSFKYAPTYHLTFSLFTAKARPSAWEIEAALEEYLSPLLASLSIISNFTIDSQVQLYATFSPSIRQPEFDHERQAWTVRKEDLGGFINAAEWPLSPSIGAGPTVNFILYVPDSAQSPLLIAENGGNSWLVPQWGGIQIMNLPFSADGSTRPTVLTNDDLRPAMHVFSNQLMSLLGLPDTPNSLPLKLSTLTRLHTTSLLSSASSTLGALARLTQSLTSIAIPDSVATSVTTTLYRLDAACTDMKEGRFASALENARVAEAEAEKAFFERSMVGQVYFPEEHKVAVYLPLLGPVAVPLVMAALKEIRLLVRGRRVQDG
ncbi:hypothetical protein NA57DRAFT_51964 [Rhizodiscina lignyota]|uniref:GPI transamidase component PIG-S n=1 Tax=Rhizodiscina lignyota TaxID=1504668 RepID=A0A9P4IMA7_9PEZI|nr:hypothetical protein NA57DRAFT_51964 [Rhizodiscina lignyota]